MRQWTEKALADSIDLRTDAAAAINWVDRVRGDAKKVYDHAFARPSHVPEAIDLLLKIGTNSAAKKIGLLAARHPAHVPHAIKALQSIGSDTAARYIGHIAVHRPLTYEDAEIGQCHLHGLPKGNEYVRPAIEALAVIGSAEANARIVELSPRDPAAVIAFCANRKDFELRDVVALARHQETIYALAAETAEWGVSSLPPGDLVALGKSSDLAIQLDCIDLLRRENTSQAGESIAALAKADAACAPTAIMALTGASYGGALLRLAQIAGHYVGHPDVFKAAFKAITEGASPLTRKKSAAVAVASMANFSRTADKTLFLRALKAIGNDHAMHWITTFAERDENLVPVVIEILSESTCPDRASYLMRLATSHADRPWVLADVVDALDDLKRRNGSLISIGQMSRLNDILRTVSRTGSIVAIRKKSETDYVSLTQLFDILDQKAVIRGSLFLKSDFARCAREADRRIVAARTAGCSPRF